MSKKHKNRNKWNYQNGYDTNWYKKGKKFDWTSYRPTATLVLSPLAYEKMYHYVAFANSEVSGFGKITKATIKESYGTGFATTEKTTYIVDDIILFDQVCSGGGTTLDGDKSYYELIKRKLKPAEWNLWWHSHYNFGVSWSGIDESAISQIITNSPGIELISTCMNQQGHLIARRDDTLHHNERMHLSLQPRTTVAQLERYEKEVKKKVKTWKYKVNYKWTNPEWNTKKFWDTPLLLTDKNKSIITNTEKISTITTIKKKEQTIYWNSKLRCFVNADNKPVTYEDISNGSCSLRGMLR